MKTKKTTYWWIDAILFTGFLLAFFMSYTGIEIYWHIGIYGGLVAFFYLSLHGDWLNAVTQRFFGKTNGITKQKFLADGAFASITGSSIMHQDETIASNSGSYLKTSD